jgi:uncharacterized membrane protein YgdD (TMEM256/DUF423 family)
MSWRGGPRLSFHFDGAWRKGNSLSARFWIFLGALFGGLAVAAGAVGAHALPDAAALAVPLRIYNTGQLYHAVHALALIGTGLALLYVEGKPPGFAKWPLQIAALAFTAGIVCFSGGIYVQAAKDFTSSAGVVPFGGVSFLVGWAALAIGALGLRA